MREKKAGGLKLFFFLFRESVLADKPLTSLETAIFCFFSELVSVSYTSIRSYIAYAVQMLTSGIIDF